MGHHTINSFVHLFFLLNSYVQWKRARCAERREVSRGYVQKRKQANSRFL